MQATMTPCYVLFNTLKRQGGISYKALALLLLSGKPLSDGRSPASRVNDRTWVSRFIVHAPAGSLQDRYFSDFTVSALRVVARLKSREGRVLTSKQILELVCNGADGEMEQALAAHHQDVALYRNVLDRLASESGFTVDERAEIAMVLFVAAGCTADVPRAVACALAFSESVHGVGVATPLVTPKRSASATSGEERAVESQPTLGLMRVVDGYLTGAPHWLAPYPNETIVGALAMGDHVVNDVGADVSSEHLKIYQDEAGAWYAQGMDSRYGTQLISGAGGATLVVELPKTERGDSSSYPVPLKPGDELILAADTRFVVLEGIAAT